jgi:hypothetical protein
VAPTPSEDAWRSLFHGFVEPRSLAAQPGVAAQRTAGRGFRFFRREDQEAAVSLAAEFAALAGRRVGDDMPRQPTEQQLQAVMERFHEVAALNVGLAQAALRHFIASWPNADVLPMPTLRQQLATLKVEQPDRIEAVRAAARAAEPVPFAEPELRYYRHDVDLSDHHQHWHSLYSWGEPVADIQGRLFLYMHEQMLARYDTERLAVGLAPAVPFLRWDDPSSWTAAFHATDLPPDALAPWITAFLGGPDRRFVAFDEQGTSPAENNPESFPFVINGLRRVHDGVTGGTYATYNDIGTDLEASSEHADAEAGPHNMGHDVLAVPPRPHGEKDYFVMYDTAVAMTTPVFYRWHRAIDDFAFAWQEAQGPDTTKYKMPPIRLRRGNAPTETRSPDIVLTPRSAINGIDKPDFDLAAWGEQRFGGDHFDEPVAGRFDVDELQTEITEDPEIPDMPILGIKTDWVYFLKLDNPSAKKSTVTVRIWLAALALRASRRHWIEMDKFVATVPSRTKKVVARGSWQSSVIRSKSVDDPMMLAEAATGPPDPLGSAGENVWCECGLPYRLLLPRGTATGMESRFLVLLTDAQEDGTEELSTPQCGSVTFCGRKTRDWPDKWEMGFPFHRPFPEADDPVFTHFDALPNAAWRDVAIRCL